MTVIRNARLKDTRYAIAVENGKIIAVTPEAEYIPIPTEEIDVEGARIVSGLVDVHTHGIMGMDTMDGGNLREMAKAYFEAGTTTVYPTTVTASPEKLYEILSQDISFPEGADIPGFHVEGPYLNEAQAGAQDKAYIKAPDKDEFARLPNASILTLAPELEGSIDLIKSTSACIALGHTMADDITSAAAFRAGAKCLTHTCNVMPPFHHLNPGPIGAAIEEDAYVQTITDGVHLRRSMVLALYRIFGVRRMVIISDSMRATGLGDGVYMLGTVRATVKDGVARTDEGRVAGSTTTLYGCVQKAIEFGIPPEDAYAMASQTPAEMMGLKKGKIEVGYDAEFLLLDDNWRMIRPLKL